MLSHDEKIFGEEMPTRESRLEWALRRIATDPPKSAEHMRRIAQEAIDNES